MIQPAKRAVTVIAQGGAQRSLGLTERTPLKPAQRATELVRVVFYNTGFIRPLVRRIFFRPLRRLWGNTGRYPRLRCAPPWAITVIARFAG